MLGLELAVRIYHGKVLHFQSFAAGGWTHGIPSPAGLDSEARSMQLPVTGPRMSMHPASEATGRSISTASRPILAVGNSFTFGDEVEDSETWAAHLEEILNKRVLNAGVGAYGIDQAFLRAELLLDKYDPDVVILSFISDDISRTEFSYYPYGGGWKPYFEYRDGSLILRNVPVPQQSRSSRLSQLSNLASCSGLQFSRQCRSRQDRPSMVA